MWGRSYASLVFAEICESEFWYYDLELGVLLIYTVCYSGAKKKKLLKIFAQKKSV